MLSGGPYGFGVDASYFAAMNDPLFEPSLQRVRTERPLYSTTTLFMSAFFGGPLAGVIVFAVNSARAVRLRREGPLIALAAIFSLALPSIVLSVSPNLDNDTGRILARVLALLLAGGLYLRHRTLYRGQDLFGAVRPNGWPLGLAAIAIAFVASLLILAAARALQGGAEGGV